MLVTRKEGLSVSDLSEVTSNVTWEPVAVEFEL